MGLGGRHDLDHHIGDSADQVNGEEEPAPGPRHPVPVSGHKDDGSQKSQQYANQRNEKGRRDLERDRRACPQCLVSSTDTHSQKHVY